MRRTVKARDWEAEIRATSGDDRCKIVAEAAKEPFLRNLICRVMGEVAPEWLGWTEDQFDGKGDGARPTAKVVALTPKGGLPPVRRPWLAKPRTKPGPAPQMKVVSQIAPEPKAETQATAQGDVLGKVRELLGLAEGTALSTKVNPPPIAFQHSKHPAGIPATLENALLAIEALNIDCKYDVFHNRVKVSEHEIGLHGDLLNNMDNVALKVRHAVLGRFHFDPGVTFTFDALRIICLDRVFDPVLDYLDGLRWDGIPRLDNWLTSYCGADDTALNRAIGRKMLVAGVRRVKQPGCKFDYITVFESEVQGIGKSTLLKLLAGEDNFSDAEIIGLDKQEQQEAVQGVWIYEIGELEGMDRGDVRHMKLFASKTVDSARPAYGRTRVDCPRRCIFVATTNETSYLRDTTGNRRFWPVKLHGVVPNGNLWMIDLAGVQRDRDQLWAEAVVAESSGEPLVIPENLWPEAAVQQQARMEIDPWADAIESAISVKVENWPPKAGTDVWNGMFCLAADEKGNPQWRVSSDWLLVEVLELPKQRQSNNHTKRLAQVMRSLGWQHNVYPMRIGKLLKRGYTKSKAQSLKPKG